MALTDPVPSDSLDVLKRNAGDLDKALNSTSNFQNRVGDTLVPVPSALSQIASAVSSALSSINGDVNAVDSAASAAISNINDNVSSIESYRLSAQSDIDDDVSSLGAYKLSAQNLIDSDVQLIDDKKSSSFSAMEDDVSFIESYKINAKSSIASDVSEVESAKDLAITISIPEKISSLGLSYPPITYVSGLTLDSNTKTYKYGDSVYVWGGFLGEVTSGNFDEQGWQLVQNFTELQIERATFTEIQALSPTITGQSFICQERGNAKYILQPDGYTPLTGDAVFTNGRVAALQYGLSARVEWFGAKGDGSTDDTQAFSDASSWLESFGGVTSGQGISLRPGSIYMVDTWKLPKFSSGGKRVYIGCKDGMSTIRKISTANTSYMVAPAKYIENLPFADTGFHFQNIEFDGNNAVDNPLICRSFNSYHDNCRFINGSLRCALLTRLSANGTDCASTLSETRFENCDFESGTATSNALIKSEGSESGHPADIYFIGNTMQGNGIAPYCCDFSKTNGWHINDNHTYNAVNEDILIRNLGRIGSFGGNQMEEGAYININETEVVNFGPGNTTWNDVSIAFPGSGSFYDAFIQNWFFRLRKDGGDTARLINIGTNKNHVVHSRDNVFEGARFDNHVSSSGGRIISSGDIDKDGEIPLSIIPSTLKSVGLDIPTYTAAQIGDISHPINTDGKYVGKGVYNTTNNTIYTSSGTAAGGGWISQRSSQSDIVPS